MNKYEQLVKSIYPNAFVYKLLTQYIVAYHEILIDGLYSTVHIVNFTETTKYRAWKRASEVLQSNIIKKLEM
jgi:hypothetical protein